MKQSSAEFPPTRWSLVLRARQSDPAGRAALEDLCAAYWYPLYAFARRCGHSPEDASDAVQGFFARIISKELFAKAEPEKGRLRSFLLGAFKYFLSGESRRMARDKRGGGEMVISLDRLQAEQWLQDEPAHAKSPDLLFERAWAQTILRRALTELESSYRQRGKAALFIVLRDFLAWDSGEANIAEAARVLQVPVGAVRVAIHRLRRAYRDCLDRQVADTVDDAAERTEELRRLLQVLSA